MFEGRLVVGMSTFFAISPTVVKSLGIKFWEALGAISGGVVFFLLLDALLPFLFR
jgi:hypothetical protein